ncbi:MAG: cell wall hydrolase [Alphaproteobacteria bacterium]|nr:cell wall hydrolase [Alphaproteobacteria bacterium]
MVASRRRPKGGRAVPFGLCILAMGTVPTQIGYQDTVALMARQPEMSQRLRARMLASPFGTIHAATFSFPRPLGTAMPDPASYRLAALDPATTGALGEGLSGVPQPRPRPAYPAVNRRLKGDLLVVRPPREDEQAPGGTRDLTPGRVKTVSFPRPADLPQPEAPVPPYIVDRPAAEPEQEPVPERATAAPSADRGAEAMPGPGSYRLASLPPQHAAPAPQPSPLEAPIEHGSAAERLGRLYFGDRPSDDGVGTIQPWPMDEEPLIQSPAAADPDMKRPPAASPAPATAAGQSVAPKGEVTGEGRRPKTPAERLKLDVKQRARAEKCLAEAVYFESRGEPKRGQIAVAQVVMNRVFSGFYPTNVCGVVYQNAHRKLACQFTFACDNVPDVVNEPRLWDQAKEIARDMLDGKLWLPEVGHSTHYHAYWVHPSWTREMRRLQVIGVHKFYRPRAWGDGSENPPLNESHALPPGRPQASAEDAKAKL